MSWFRKRSNRLQDWRALLESADGNAIEAALMQRAPRKATSLDEVISQLADPEQAKVLAYWQRSRWAPTSQSASLQELRRAFRDGPQWREAETGRQSKLPPLYPQD